MPFVKFKSKRYGYTSNDLKREATQVSDWYRVYVPYFALVFKNDVIEFREELRHVYSIITRTKYKKYYKLPNNFHFDQATDRNRDYSDETDWVKSSAYENQEITVDVNTYGKDSNSGTDIKNAILYKRPLINWIKYFIVLITGRYIK